MTYYFKHYMKGLVLSDEESVKEKLFGFDEAMEVNSNTVVLHCASIIMLMPFSRRDFRSKRLSRNRWTAWLLMIFQIIWKHQNPPDCSKAKFLITSAYRSGMWSDDVSCMLDLPAYSHYICQAIQWCDRRWLTLELVSSFDKNNPYYAHGWLILHCVSYSLRLVFIKTQRQEIQRIHNRWTIIFH